MKRGKRIICFVTADELENIILMFDSMSDLYKHVYRGKPFSKYYYNLLTSKISKATSSESHINFILGYKTKVYLVSDEAD